MSFVENYFAKDVALAVLNSPDANKVKTFLFGGNAFSSGFFAHVAGVIDKGFVHVKYDESQKGKAEYDISSNTLLLGFWENPSIVKKALLLHEATHVFYDLISQKMPLVTSEGIAYIVQCQYLRVNSPAGTKRIEGIGLGDKVFEVAWDVAGKILAGGGVSAEDEADLRLALSKHPYYASKAAGDAGFNGL
jgi:hypothetical protein